MLKASCALTLARKFKLRTLSKTFRKFGGELKCPETEISLFKQGSLKVSHEFKPGPVTERRYQPSLKWKTNLRGGCRVLFVDQPQT